ncbi:MAG: hypothetical protein M3P30_07700 [Chloroflexota bacterium]|nr:hypothetical protein [Chloroflexota bacterium]
MPFVIAMSLVMLISTVLLLYQFWNGSLAGDDAESVSESEAARRPDLKQAA